MEKTSRILKNAAKIFKKFGGARGELWENKNGERQCCLIGAIESAAHRDGYGFASANIPRRVASEVFGRDDYSVSSIIYEYNDQVLTKPENKNSKKRIRTTGYNKLMKLAKAVEENEW